MTVLIALKIAAIWTVQIAVYATVFAFFLAIGFDIGHEVYQHIKEKREQKRNTLSARKLRVKLFKAMCLTKIMQICFSLGLASEKQMINAEASWAEVVLLVDELDENQIEINDKLRKAFETQLDKFRNTNFNMFPTPTF